MRSSRSNPLLCRECGATLDYVTQMEHWDWHRNQRARLSELEGRIEALERQHHEEADARREALERE